MEELLMLALLLQEGLIQQDEYEKRIDDLFLLKPENEILLHLEWEKDIKQAVIFIRTYFSNNSFDIDAFGKILMAKLKIIYNAYPNINDFGNQMYNLWESLPGIIQDKEPFQVLCYADDSLSWSDEKQARQLYEQAFSFYD